MLLAPLAHRILRRSSPLALVLTLTALVPAQGHPVPVSDCGDCHVDPVTHELDLQAIHDYDCERCHPGFDFSTTILGPIGSWNRECTGCHNPTIAQTGNLPAPTNGHRCIVCHGQQRSTANARSLHAEHSDKVDCAVCHGRQPDLGHRIGSGDRSGCLRCHSSHDTGASLRELHREMTEEGLNCHECHNGERPPVDVFPTPPVGNTTIVCRLCHSNASPSQFWTNGRELHQEHVEEGLGCSSCHLDANAQDDQAVMPPRDDPRRMMLSRGGYAACVRCHERGTTASVQSVHRQHVGRNAQWCYDCHDGADLRPIGQAPPVQAPAESCMLCHSNRTYTAAFPFAVHEEHADRGIKCYACHQGTPPLTGWPERWRRPHLAFDRYGHACQGSWGGTPRIGSQGMPQLGRAFDVTLTGAPPNREAFLAVGRSVQVHELTSLGMPGCELLLQQDAAFFAVANHAGVAAVTQRVPNDRSLTGAVLHYQWFVIDAAANQLGLVASDGGRAIAGN